MLSLTWSLKQNQPHLTPLVFLCQIPCPSCSRLPAWHDALCACLARQLPPPSRWGSRQTNLLIPAVIDIFVHSMRGTCVVCMVEPPTARPAWQSGLSRWILHGCTGTAQATHRAYLSFHLLRVPFAPALEADFDSRRHAVASCKPHVEITPFLPRRGPAASVCPASCHSR